MKASIPLAAVASGLALGLGPDAVALGVADLFDGGPALDLRLGGPLQNPILGLRGAAKLRRLRPDQPREFRAIQ